jgi:hypothetical protein
MKKILIATVLAAFAVTPALAQQSPWSGWRSNVQYAPSQTYMYAPTQGYVQPDIGYMGSSPDVVIENGILLGQDPDANVRLQLRREAIGTEGYSLVPGQ